MSERRRAPNMYDVAEHAGVSHQTVSRVLNGFEGIRPVTRDRVMAAIEELGYRRNLAASTLASSRSRAIGVLTPASHEFGPVSTLLAVEHAIRDAGYRPLQTSAAPTTTSVRSGIDLLAEHAVEALVVIATYRVLLDQLEGVEAPVLVLQAGPGGGFDSVTVDHDAGISALVDHLSSLGHRRLQYVAGPAGFIEADLRRASFERAIADRHLPPLPVIDGDWTADAGFAAADRLDPSATAVVAGNDQVALGLVHGLVRAGRSIPEEVSVVGYDDIPEAAHALPPLTTVRQDFAAVGRVAVARIVHRLEQAGSDATPAIIASRIQAPADPIVPELVVRHSTAGPTRP